jgi:hypothetical protein
MDRRDMMKLLALSPLALQFKPIEREAEIVGCDVCGAEVLQVFWPGAVLKHGKAECRNHGNLITDFHFGKHPDATLEEYQAACSYDGDPYKDMAERIIREMFENNSELRAKYPGAAARLGLKT